MLTRLGKFEIVRLLAQGSMGEVYVGRDVALGREVAIKVIHASAAIGPEARERFAKEARAAGTLNHPNIVTVHEMGEEQGVLYLAMELVKGEDLGTLIRVGNLTPKDVLEVLAQICDGLAVAHSHQVLHRDIKPSNIRVNWDGKKLHAKLLDFGVAKLIDSDTTDEGTVLGTVNYMAPEYVQSGRPDPRSDLFAVGVILQEALTGIPPFDGPSPGSVIYRVLHDTPAPLPPTAFRGVSRDLQGVVSQALAKDPNQRFQSAEEMALVLRQAKDPGWEWDRLKPASTFSLKRLMGGSGKAPATAPSRGTAVPPLPPPAPPLPVTRASGAHAQAVPRPKSAPKPPPVASPAASPAPAQKAEIHQDLLETTRIQLLQALEIDPDNARTVAMLLVTYYRLGRVGPLMQTLRQARDRGLPAGSLRSVPRCAQLVQEEQGSQRLPAALHHEFLDYLAH